MIAITQCPLLAETSRSPNCILSGCCCPKAAAQYAPQDPANSDMDQGKLEELHAVLASMSSGADLVNECGTKLIGHEPSIAPKAYRHVIYAKLSPEHEDEFQRQVGQPLPEEYLQFLRTANGMILSNGAIRVFGYVPLVRDRENKIHNYPPSATASNTYPSLSRASGRNFIVGFYKDDGSYVYIDSSGQVVRFDYENDSSVINGWDSFSDWLVSEIERLDVSRAAHN